MSNLLTWLPPPSEPMFWFIMLFMIEVVLLTGVVIWSVWL